MQSIQLRQLALSALFGIVGGGLSIIPVQAVASTPAQSGVSGTTSTRAAVNAKAGPPAPVPASVQATSVQAKSVEAPPTDKGLAKLQQVVVTGTLIRGVAPVGTNVISVGREQIANSGALRTQDLFNSMPVVTSSFNTVQSPGSGLSGGTSVHASIHDIGASGANSTLTLINGHDVVGVGILQTTPDIGILPPAALGRVAVVANGGSALYGADAIGGVINLITRKEMEGAQFSAHAGFTPGYKTHDANFAFGHEWSDGSYMVTYSYHHNTNLLGVNRSYYRSNLVPFGGTDYRATECELSNVTVAGITYAMPSLVAGTENRCDQALTSDIVPSSTQSSVYGAFNYDLSDAATFHLTTMWTDRTTGIHGPQLTASGIIDDTNPYFIPINGATSQSVDYSFASASSPVAEALTGIHVFGITPSLDIQLGGSWTMNALVHYGHSNTQAHTPQFNSAANDAALAGTTTATALDPYLPSQTNDQVIDKILDFQQYGTNKQTLVEAKAVAQGALASMPGGPLHAAIGAEYEYVGAEASQIDAPYGSIAGIRRAHTNVRDTSVFGELMVPLVGVGNSIPGVRRLTLDLQGRLDHYNIFGSTTNPKASIEWQVVRGFKLQGSWGTSFVAPSSADLTGSVDTRMQTIPVSALGPGPFNTRPTLILAGGGKVEPITSTTYTGGMVIAPTWLPTMSFRLTYWNTKVKHLVTIFPVFSGPIFFNNFPGRFIVNPTLAQVKAFIGDAPVVGPSLASMYNTPGRHPYVIMDAQRTNLGSQSLSGLDLHWGFNKPTSFGRVTASVAGTYLLTEHTVELEGSPAVNRLTAVPGVTRLRASASIGIQYHQFTGRVRMNYSGGFDVAEPGQTYVAPFHPVNVFLAYDLGDFSQSAKGWRLTLRVNNVTNEKPSFYNLATLFDGIERVSGNGLTVGRLFMVGVQARF